MPFALFHVDAPRGRTSHGSRPGATRPPLTHRHGTFSLSDLVYARSFDLRSPPRPFRPRRIKSLCGHRPGQPQPAAGDYLSCKTLQGSDQRLPAPRKRGTHDANLIMRFSAAEREAGVVTGFSLDFLRAFTSTWFGPKSLRLWRISTPEMHDFGCGMQGPPSSMDRISRGDLAGSGRKAGITSTSQALPPRSDSECVPTIPIELSRICSSTFRFNQFLQPFNPKLKLQR